MIKAFSLKRNLRTLLDTESTQNDINCLNGIRSLNALSLILFHKSVALFFNPYVNRTYMTEVKEPCNWILSYCPVAFRKNVYCIWQLYICIYIYIYTLVRQGRSLSPPLFNLYSEYLAKEALDWAWRLQHRRANYSNCEIRRWSCTYG